MADEGAAPAAETNVATATATPATAPEGGEQGTPAQTATDAPKAGDLNADGLVPGETGYKEGDGKEGDKEPEGVPEKYDLTKLQSPDPELEIDEATAKKFAEIAKESGLSQKNFEGVFNKFTAYLKTRQDEGLHDIMKEWTANARKDTDIGGAKWKENLSIARNALNKFADAEVLELLQKTGLHCHPGVIRMFRNIGRAVGNDVTVRGTPSAGSADIAKAFFNNSNMN